MKNDQAPALGTPTRGLAMSSDEQRLLVESVENIPVRFIDSDSSADADSGGPAPAPGAPQKRRWWQRKWGWEVLLVIYAGYDGSRLLVSGSLSQAQRHGRELLSIEQNYLHFSPEHMINRAFADHAWLGIPGDFVYATLHYVVTLAVLVWIWRNRQEHYRTARTALMLTTLLGVIGFVVFPTAPPRLLEASYGYVDVLAQHASVGWWGAGGGGTPRGFESMSNEFAAMPSLHVGWALWCGMLLFRHSRRLVVRLLGLLYPVGIAFVVMGTANHYLLDCLVGAAVSLVGMAATGPLLRLADRVVTALRSRLSGRRPARR
jgi:hypothetical protein